MSYFHSQRRLTLLWDGAEDGITDNLYEYQCPICSEVSSFTFADAVEIMVLSVDLRTYLVTENLVSKGEFGYEVKKGITAYCISLTCNSCKNNIWLIVGIKEIQPQRYNCYLK
jgi:hypothetical protein